MSDLDSKDMQNAALCIALRLESLAAHVMKLKEREAEDNQERHDVDSALEHWTVILRDRYRSYVRFCKVLKQPLDVQLFQRHIKTIEHILNEGD